MKKKKGSDSHLPVRENVVTKMRQLFFMKRKRIQFINFHFGLSYKKFFIEWKNLTKFYHCIYNLYKALSYHCCYKHIYTYGRNKKQNNLNKAFPPLLIVSPLLLGNQIIKNAYTTKDKAHYSIKKKKFLTPYIIS